MGCSSTDRLSTVVALILMFALILLGVCFGIVTKRMVYNSNNQLVEQLDNLDGTVEEVVLVSEDGELIQKSAKDEFKFDPRIYGFVLYTRLFSVVCYILALINIILLVCRLKYSKKDKMWTFTTIKGYFDFCNQNQLRCCEVQNYTQGDIVVFCKDTPYISLYDYLFKVKEKGVVYKAFAVKNGSLYTVKGIVEYSGMYYKVDNYYIPKNEMYLKDKDEVELLIYADDKSTLKVNNNYILQKFKVVE